MATTSDQSYKKIAMNQFDKFIQGHRSARRRAVPKEILVILRQMLHYNPENRPTITSLLGNPIFENCNFTSQLKEEMDYFVQ